MQEEAEPGDNTRARRVEDEVTTEIIEDIGRNRLAGHTDGSVL